MNKGNASKVSRARARFYTLLLALMIVPACQCEGDQPCSSDDECGGGQACCTYVCVSESSPLCSGATHQELLYTPADAGVY